MHDGGGTLANGQVVAPLLQFVSQVAVLIGLGRVTGGDAGMEIGGTVLTEMLVAGAVPALGIGGQFGEKGEGERTEAGIPSFALPPFLFCFFPSAFRLWPFPLPLP